MKTMEIRFDFTRITTEMWICLGVSFVISMIILHFLNKVYE